MALARLQVVKLLLRRQVGAQVLRGFRLTDARNVVPLALDGHQRGAGDLGGVDA